MPSSEVWGPSVWTFFHTLAEKINEKYFFKLRSNIFNIIKLTCRNLPCPKCASEASIFLEKTNINKINNKQEFINFIYMFHNYVNKKKNKPLFSSTKLNIYKNIHLSSAFLNFIKVFHTRGNMQLLTESFQRDLAIKEIIKWMKAYGKAFIN
jgi:hypothetical protein